MQRLAAGRNCPCSVLRTGPGRHLPECPYRAEETPTSGRVEIHVQPDPPHIAAALAHCAAIRRVRGGKAMTDEDPQPVVTGLPIVVGSDGQPYIDCDAVLMLLRAIASSSRKFADDPECDLRTLAVALDLEADALEVRAIAHTAPRR